MVKNRYIPYACDLTDFKLLSKGQFTQVDVAGKALNLFSSKTYLLDKSDFHVRILPSLTSVSHHVGNSEGGLDLLLKGLAWDEKNTKVYADGTECKIISGPTFDTASKEYELTCRT